jgi:hypothetical protein
VSAYTPVITDLSSAGGPKSAPLLDSIVQQIDLRTGLVMFEWHALGHVPLSASESPVPSNGTAWDYFHINSVQPTGTGSIVISARGTWAGYDISERNGGIIWTLGGKRSTFKMGPGAQFAWQHDIQLRPDNTVTVFDDEAAPPEASQSRGLILKLDLKGHTASVAHQYTHPTPLLSGSQGNMQTLANGDELVGWGAQPFLSEFNAAGALIFDARLPAGDESYRAFRNLWNAQPTAPPDLAVSSATGTKTAYASWNGATDVARWQVEAGASASSLSAVGSVARNGFETAIPLTNAGPFYAVQALSSAGKVLATSKTVQG